MINSNIKNISIFLQLILFFFIDICLFSLYSQPICYLLLYRYVLHIVDPVLTVENVVKAIGIVFLLLLESILFHGCLRPSFFCFILITVAFFQVRQVCYLNRFLFIFLTAFLLFLQMFLIEGLLFDPLAGNNYTFIKIAVNLVLIVFFSLKLHFQGSQDNRCLG